MIFMRTRRFLIQRKNKKKTVLTYKVSVDNKDQRNPKQDNFLTNGSLIIFDLEKKSKGNRVASDILPTIK